MRGSIGYAAPGVILLAITVYSPLIKLVVLGLYKLKLC